MYGHVINMGEFKDMMDEIRTKRIMRDPLSEPRITFKSSPMKNTTGASWSPNTPLVENIPDDNPHTAASMLHEGAKCLQDRASERDRECGERSMAACVEAFNALTGHKLTEEDGWLFMAVLKMSRSRGGNFRRDDFVDGAAYMALAGEAAAEKGKR